MSVAWAAYRLMAPVAGVVAPLGRWLAPSAERPLWAERLGDLRASGPADVWVHAASMGEAVAVRGVLAELRRHAPEAVLRLTATTRTGRQRLEALGEAVSLAPLDTPQATSRFFARVGPRRLLLLETELWPQWLLTARARGTGVAVLNARLSARSLARYRWMGRGFAGLVAGLEAVLCQSDDDRDRWLALGARAERTATVGNLKNDGLPEPAQDRCAARAELGLDAERPLLVLGSLRPGEAAPLAAAWRSVPAATRERWQVVAVPRHAHASDALEREAEQAGVPAATNAEPGPGAWRWDERPGVLVRYYRAADAAFVGGTLGSYGGHNPLEPAACGAVVMSGPHLESQAPALAILRPAGAIEVAETPAALAAALQRVLQDPRHRAERASAALAAVARAKGATRRAVDRLTEWGVWPA